MTSKDEEQLKNFLKALKIDLKIGLKKAGKPQRIYRRVQIGDVLFYEFLLSIGLTQRKSKTMGVLDIPEKYFFDFLRGAFDGDGCTYSYWDKRWKSSFMFYLEFVSASKQHVDWLRSKIENRLQIRGHITGAGRGVLFQLKYAKKDSLKIIKKMYYSDAVVHLSRKKEKINKMLEIAGITAE